jgi:hypothetical protein
MFHILMILSLWYDTTRVLLTYANHSNVKYIIINQIGYGDTSDGGEASDILLEVTVDAYADTFCDSLYRDYDPLIMVCAGTEGTRVWDDLHPPVLCSHAVDIFQPVEKIHAKVTVVRS